MDSFTFDGHQTPEAKAKGWRKAQAEETTDAEAEAKGRFLFPECHGSFPEKR